MSTAAPQKCTSDAKPFDWVVATPHSKSTLVEGIDRCLSAFRLLSLEPGYLVYPPDCVGSREVLKGAIAMCVQLLQERRFVPRESLNDAEQLVQRMPTAHTVSTRLAAHRCTCPVRTAAADGGQFAPGFVGSREILKGATAVCAQLLRMEGGSEAVASAVAVAVAARDSEMGAMQRHMADLEDELDGALQEAAEAQDESLEMRNALVHLEAALRDSEAKRCACMQPRGRGPAMPAYQRPITAFSRFLSSATMHDAYLLCMNRL